MILVTFILGLVISLAFNAVFDELLDDAKVSLNFEFVFVRNSENGNDKLGTIMKNPLSNIFSAVVCINRPLKGEDKSEEVSWPEMVSWPCRSAKI